MNETNQQVNQPVNPVQPQYQQPVYQQPQYQQPQQPVYQQPVYQQPVVQDSHIISTTYRPWFIKLACISLVVGIVSIVFTILGGALLMSCLR